jgi:hypothetical protein
LAGDKSKDFHPPQRRGLTIFTVTEPGEALDRQHDLADVLA